MPRLWSRTDVIDGFVGVVTFRSEVGPMPWTAGLPMSMMYEVLDAPLLMDMALDMAHHDKNWKHTPQQGKMTSDTS